MATIEQFLDLVDRYKRETDLAESTVSTRIFNDGKRIELLRGGRDVGIRKVEDAIEWFSENWPKGATWPASIKRPRVSGRLEHVAR